MLTSISCNIFYNLCSQNGGNVLSTCKGNIYLFQNEFIKVRSEKSPGCLFVQNCENLLLENNYFSECFGEGGDTKFGNVLNVLSTLYEINHFSAFLCSPSTTQSCDSLIHSEQTNFIIKFYNSSNCYGYSGSSSVCIWHSPGANNKFAFTITSSTLIEFDVKIYLKCDINSNQNQIISTQSLSRILIIHVSLFLLF